MDHAEDDNQQYSSLLSNNPGLWSISYNAVMDLEQTALARFGPDTYSRMTMRDINREFIIPKCRETGLSYALSLNPQGLPADAFITHSWDGIFPDFVQAIRSVFQTSVVKPNLWICAFALYQGDKKVLERQVSGVSLASSPFVRALEQAKQFVVVRNTKSDLYSRIWCVCELLFAKSSGLVPDRTHVTGPDHFSNSKISCLDAQSTEPEDKARILKYLLNQHRYQDIDEMVYLFRTQEAPVIQTPLSSVFSGTMNEAKKRDNKDESLSRLRSVLHPLHDEDEQLMSGQMKKFAKGTRDWVLERFDSWLSDTTTIKGKSRIFILAAVAGVGKTGIMCKLAKERPEHVVASHFCRHDDDRRNDPKRMLLSIVYQLAVKFPDYKEHLETMMDEDKLSQETLLKRNINSIFNELLKVPLGKLNLDNSQKFVILIDALDECETKGKNEILLCIQRHFLRLPPWLYVYLTTRPEVPVMEKLKRFTPKLLEPTTEENQRDLRIFYRQLLDSQRDKLAESFDIEKAVLSLVDKSGGLFIYATFLADQIRQSDTGSITQKVVEQFPNDLDEYYEEQLDRICIFDSECREWEIVKLVLSAAEPLHVEVIQAFLDCSRKEMLEAVKTLSQFFQAGS